MKLSEIRKRIKAGDFNVASQFVDAVIAAVTEHTFDEEEDPLGMVPIAEYLATYGVEVDRCELSRRDYTQLLRTDSSLKNKDG